jgi:hypothetical protein
MAKFLLDYVFKVSAVTPTPEASTGFLKQACVVCKPKSGVEAGSITSCVSQAAIAALTDNVEAQQLLNAGLSKVYILLSNDLNIADELVGVNDFYTVLISSDFDDENVNAYATEDVTITSYANLVDAGNDEITIGETVFVAQAGAATLGQATFQAATSNEATATSLAAQINAHATAGELVTAEATGAVVSITYNEYGAEGNEFALAYSDEGTATIGATVGAATLSGGTSVLDTGTFDGVVGLYNQDFDECATNAAVEKQCGFYGNATNKAKNMMFAFGKLLSNSLNWVNQQYISMPLGDGIASLGESETLFDDKVSFVITDDEFSHRLALFAAGAKAIVAPYITRNLEINLQSDALSFISGNTPAYTKKYATLLENELKDTIQDYIDRGWIEDGTVSILLENDNFVASGYINITEPNALWRVFAEMRQTL